MISRVFVGGCALAAGSVAFVCSAQAADLPPAPRPSYVAPVVYAPPVYNWTGFYVGGNIGGGFADSSWTDPFGGSNNKFSKDGFIGGGQVGANYQFNWLVVGIEGDFDWTGLKATGADSIGDSLTANTQWTATATGRIGAAFDRVLVYAKAGAAFAHERDSMNDSVFTATTDFNRTGWTAGAGVEYALAQNWTAKLEYDYLGFGSESESLATPTTPFYPTNSSLNFQEVKAGINYKFGP
jgi:outer membrane immunogenic protein